MIDEPKTGGFAPVAWGGMRLEAHGPYNGPLRRAGYDAGDCRQIVVRKAVHLQG